MTSHEIKSFLWKHNIRQRDIAVDLGITAATVCDVINGRTTSRPVMEYIAKRISKDPKRIWGNRYKDVKIGHITGREEQAQR